LVFSKSTIKNFREASEVIFGGNTIYPTFALVNEATEGNGFVPFFIFVLIRYGL